MKAMCVRQQDLISCHNSGKNHKCLLDSIYDFIRPISSFPLSLYFDATDR